MTQDYMGRVMSRSASERERIVSRRSMIGKTALAGDVAALAVTAFPTLRFSSGDV